MNDRWAFTLGVCQSLFEGIGSGLCRTCSFLPLYRGLDRRHKRGDSASFRRRQVKPRGLCVSKKRIDRHTVATVVVDHPCTASGLAETDGGLRTAISRAHERAVPHNDCSEMPRPVRASSLESGRLGLCLVVEWNYPCAIRIRSERVRVSIGSIVGTCVPPCVLGANVE